MSDAQLLPLYQCHKQVRACKIEAISNVAGGWEITPTDRSLDPVRVPRAYVEKHNPQPGGYLVAYRDGYLSYSPAREFEDGYTLATGLEDRRAQLRRQLAEVEAAIEAARTPQGD